MLGTGSLPFRGGVNPLTTSETIQKYPGVRTLTIQSAFRYDYAEKRVKEAIHELNRELPHLSAVSVPKKLENTAKESVSFFEKPYRETIEKIAPLINILSKQVAKRRERVQHVGLFGYSRGVGKVTLPRAIPFTASLYSIGIPPEIIGTGRGLLDAKKKGVLSEILHLYPTLKNDIIQAGYFFNQNTLEKTIGSIKNLNGLRKDIEGIEEIFHIELGPKEPSHFEHKELTDTIYEDRHHKKVSDLITRSGVLRKSLG